MATDATESRTGIAGAFHFEPFAADFHFPTSLTFDEHGRCHVAESGLPFADAPPGGRRA